MFRIALILSLFALSSSMKLTVLDDAKPAEQKPTAAAEEAAPAEKAAAEKAPAEPKGPSMSEDEAWVQGLPEKHLEVKSGPLKWANFAQ